MTPQQRDEKIAEIMNKDLFLPIKAKMIERIWAEFRTGEHGDGRLAEERARYEAYDTTPSNV